MKIFKQGLAKSLILFLAILVIASIFNLALVTDDALAAYGIDARIKQVKTADSPAVYYLDHKFGFRKAYVSEKAFLSYGNKMSEIRVISQEQLNRWLEISLVKTKSSNQVYYIKDGQKALIESEQQFIDNGFKWGEIMTIGEADLNEYKLSAFDKVKASLISIVRANNSATASSGLLKISSLPIDQAYLPTGSRNNTVAAFKFESFGQEARITNLTFGQQGVSSDDLIEAAYLADESENIYGERSGLNSRHFQVNLGSQPIIIPVGAAKVLSLKVDLRAVSGVSGQTIKFAIVNPLDIVSGGQISAIFPLLGQEFRLLDGTGNLGQVKIEALAQNSADKVYLGADNQAVAAFRLTESSGHEEVIIKKIVLTNVGSALDSNLGDFTLIDHNGLTINKGVSLTDRKVVFNLLPGYLIKPSHYVDFTVKANILGGDGREFKLIINNDNDVVALSGNTGYSVTVLNQANAADANRFLIARTPVFLTTAVLKAVEATVSRDQADAVLGSFELRNNTSDIKLSSLTLSIIKSSGAPELVEPLVAFEAKSGAVLGTVLASKVTNVFNDLNLGNYQLAKGKTLTVKFKTRIPDTAKSGDNYQVYVKSANYRTGSDNTMYSDQVELAGQKLPVVKPTLYLYEGDRGSEIAVAGVKKAYLGFFKLEATQEQNLKINKITITNAAGYTPVNYDKGFTNLALYIGGSRVSDFISQPNGNSYVFDNLKIYLSAGRSANLYVRADLAPNAQGPVKLILENAIAQDYYGRAWAEVNNKNAASPEVEITRTILAASSLTPGLILANQKDNQAASLTLTNQASEGIRLYKIILNSAGSAGNFSANNGFTNLRVTYENDNGRTVSAGSRTSRPVAEVNEINLSGFILKPEQSLTFSINIDAGETAAGPVRLFIQDIQAKGQLSSANATISGTPTQAVEVAVN